MQKLCRQLFVLMLCCWATSAFGRTVVADSATRSPLPNASVFDCDGTFIGVCDSKGRLPSLSVSRLPFTIRYLGYEDAVINEPGVDTVFMCESTTVLPEIVIESKKHSVLHLLAYVREYSTLSTLTDTVSLFREKMVDFMKPVVPKSRFKGWVIPRLLNARSYYRFTNEQGLDSVSDRCSYHFSWTDWMGLSPDAQVPASLFGKEVATDTVFGKYSMTELWHKNREKITLSADVLADTTSRKWVPNLSLFFHKGIDFERFNVNFAFDNVLGTGLDASNLTAYSFNIESNGRGRGMFMFNRRDESVYVSTYCEVYIIDREYITEKEARKWEKKNARVDNIDFFIPSEAPDLQDATKMLVARVNALDHDMARLSSTPDLSHVGYRTERLNPGQRILRRLKGVLGIDKVSASRKWKKNYNNFRREQQTRNNNRNH